MSGGSGETEDGYVVDLIYAGATPEFRFSSEKPTEPVVLTVYERYEGEAAVVAKTYTLSELKALAQTEVVGYQHWKNGSEKVIASNLYATVGSLLADAGVRVRRRRCRHGGRSYGTLPRRSPMRTAASISIMSTRRRD